MDAHYSNDASERPIFYSMYNTLVGYGTDFGINPELAKSWEVSGDGKTVTFKLQEGVKFHNGDVFDAEVVKWNYDRLLREDDPLPLHGQVSYALNSVTVVDKYTVNFNMEKPYRPLMSDLGERPGFIMPPKPIEEKGSGYPYAWGDKQAGGTYSLNPVGTGPFKFKSWKIDQRVVLEKNEDFWQDGKPYLDQINYISVPDQTVRLAMLRTGDVHVISDVRIQDIPTIEANSNLRTTKLESGKWHAIRFNTKHAPYNDQKLRNAMAYSIDRETITETYFGGAASPAYLSEGNSWAWDSSVKPFEFNLDKAKATLAESGYTGAEIPIWCRSTTTEIELCEIYQAMMAEAGIKLKITGVMARDAWRGFVRGDYRMAPTTWRPRADPHGRLVRIYHAEGQSNVPDYVDSTVTSLLDKAVGEYDQAKAKPLYIDAQKRIAETGWHVYIAYVTVYAGLNNDVQNFKLYPDLMERLAWVWLDK